jgi:hypothetical protein
MLLNLAIAVLLLLFLISFPVLLLFLPAIIELKKPKDGGPRLIEENLPRSLFQLSGIVRIVDIDKAQKLDGLVVRSMAKAIDFLPNLET